jgi:hypothetical protein
MHISFDELLRAGMLPINTVGEPGTHGAVVAGTQGIGVIAPRAAAVAAATIGLLIELHIPNGVMFAIGLLSMIVAAIMLFAITGGPWGMAVSTPGAAPKLH